MTWPDTLDYLLYIWLPSGVVLFVGWLLGLVTALLLLHWCGVDIWHTEVSRKSNLVIPHDHVVTTAPTLQDIQRLGGKSS